MESSYRRHSFALGFHLILLSLLAGVLAPPVFAQETDQVGIFYDAAYTENEVFTETLPAIVPAHLVLLNPTAPGGVGGWECRLKIEGPATLASTEYVGQAINVETPPFYMVGVGDPPLPGGDQVRLATFQILVTEADPIVLSLLPLYQASLPGEMAYLAGDGSGEILPMTPVTGEEMVAFINVDSTPVCELVPSVLGFPETPLGSREQRSFTIENPGIVPLELTLDLPDDCGPFRLVYPAEGEFQVPARSSSEVTVAFEPETLGYQECLLQLGSVCPDITVYGIGREPILSWQAPTAIEFEETVVGGSSSHLVTIRNIGETAFTVTPYLAPEVIHFTVSSQQERTIYPGSQYSFYVYYRPDLVGSHTAVLEMGDTVPPITLTGSAREPVTSWDVPELLDFGEVDYGQSVTLPLTIANTGDELLYVNFGLDPDCTAFTISNLTNAYISAGQSYTLDVTFAPQVLGTTTCLLDLGPVVPPVTLTGLSLNDVTDWTISPEEMVFPMVVVGSTFTINAIVSNVGNTPLDMDAELTSGSDAFTIDAGGDPVTLLPGQAGVVTVRFMPPAAGDYSAELDFGGGLGIIPVSGTSEEPFFDCDIYPTEIAFGTVNIGQSLTRSIGVTNRGNQVLVLSPSEDSPHYHVGTALIAVPPGVSVYVEVVFSPISEGIKEVDIDLGHEACGSVHCIGTGNAPLGFYDNLVGFTFDPGSLSNGWFEYESWAPTGTVVQAYLALLNPTSADPLAGWELCAKIDGPSTFVSWDIPGLPINVLEEPCFMVGLGEPMPPAQYYVLAVADIFVASADAVSILSLGPVYHASLPDQMAWLAGNDPGEILPMQTPNNVAEVAFIHAYDIVAVSAPLPTAQADGGSIELSWSLPEGGFDTCRVYRRLDGEAERLVHSLSLEDGVRDLAYRDEAAGVPPGSTLFYSYALLENGIEKARSPEVEITLPAALPQLTQLLPNVPNPFNPQTEIRFELQKAGPVRVGIYDVTGRLVRTLVDESREAGPHAKIWNGCDDRGRQSPSGAYYVRLETPERLDRRKVMLLK